MTERESKVIRNFILKANVEEMEFYEELYDHIASSFENRSNKAQSIDEHIDFVISPKFGGIEGIEKMVSRQRVLKKRAIYRQIASELLSYLTTLSGLIKIIAIGLIIMLLNEYTDTLSTVGSLALIIPCLAAQLMRWNFKRICKKNKLPYTSSFTNRIIFIVSISSVAILQGIPDIISRITSGYRFNSMTFLSQFEYIKYPVILLLVIYALTCFSLLQNRVKLKTQPEI